MPDAAGMPTAAEVLQKINLIRPDQPSLLSSADLAADISSVLAATIAHFQSPVGYGNGGGTGRTFVPTTTTRLYDGSGGPEQLIDDVLPDQSVVINIWGSTIFDAVIKNPASPGEGYNVISRSGLGATYAGGLSPGVFSRGLQNISVTATFGTVVTTDIWEAIRCEAAYRLVVEGFIDVTGVGIDLKLEDFEMNNAVGVQNFRMTSPLMVFHDCYLSAVTRYRLNPHRGWSILAARRQMS